MAEANKFCFLHRVYAPGEPRKKERIQIIRPVKKVAESRIEPNKEYKRIVKEKMKDSNQCEIKSPVCIKLAGGLHHKKRRGINYLNKEFLIRACNPCNSFLENNVEWAKENGFVLSRFLK